MNKAIIKVDDLGKSYLIGHERQQGYMALRDVVAKNTKGFLKGIQNAISGKQLMGGQEIEEFWALKNINFEIKEGDAVGIIGRNGAGKSTLLKLLSRITEPTKGRIELNGRVASLLEVGTGFHPELTGRENIFLNGAILGMSRTEIKNKFDEIVDFSSVEKFLDTPVKRYSSGMYVRLAFAVAAHLEPEILVVDEVLAVGDAEFQKKCLGKMDDVAKKGGRTVLFVSHNMTAIKQLCNKCLYLVNGTLHGYGDTDAIITKYINEASPQTNIFKPKDKPVFFVGFSVSNNDNNDNVIRPGRDCYFEFKLQLTSGNNLPVHIAFGINDKYGNRLFTPYTRNNNEPVSLSNGENTVVCKIDKLPLKPDLYYLHLYVGSEYEAFDYISEGISIEVAPHPYYTSFMPDESQGQFLTTQSWYKK
jgi:lipopolysaccharide transport system ATP-binding protein